MADGLTSLKLLDYSDRELLAVVNDETRDDGFARTSDVRDRLGLPKHDGNRSVGIRLAWLKRFGVIENGGPTKWRLSAIGLVFLNGSLSKDTEQWFAELEPGELYSLTRLLGRRQKRAEQPVGHMLRREWTASTWKEKK